MNKSKINLVSLIMSRLILLGWIVEMIFITLKLTGTGKVATWGWLWVLSPIFIILAIGVIGATGALVYALFFHDPYKEMRRKAKRHLFK